MKFKLRHEFACVTGQQQHRRKGKGTRKIEGGVGRLTDNVFNQFFLICTKPPLISERQKCDDTSSLFFKSNGINCELKEIYRLR